ncbi:MAG: membrane protein YqaA with SNARE-associated domain [Planctomycetota bacterium]|jgi:membrane protein YqaA with SNARE-associated domain
MRLFENIYNRVMAFSRLPKAPYYLSALSFFESFILPFPPPDVMLAPMAMAKPEKAMKFATLTLVFSVLGGLVGYFIGAFLFDSVAPYIEAWGYQARFDRVMLWFQQWGFWAVLVAGFSPVPYKIFTIAAGVLNLAILPFLFASILGRGLRFFLVAWCLATFGPAIEPQLTRYIERIGWVVVGLLTIAIGLYYF